MNATFLFFNNTKKKKKKVKIHGQISASLHQLFGLSYRRPPLGQKSWCGRRENKGTRWYSDTLLTARIYTNRCPCCTYRSGSNGKLMNVSIAGIRATEGLRAAWEIRVQLSGEAEFLQVLQCKSVRYIESMFQYFDMSNAELLHVFRACVLVIKKTLNKWSVTDNEIKDNEECVASWQGGISVLDMIGCTENRRLWADITTKPHDIDCKKRFSYANPSSSVSR